MLSKSKKNLFMFVQKSWIFLIRMLTYIVNRITPREQFSKLKELIRPRWLDYYRISFLNIISNHELNIKVHWPLAGYQATIFNHKRKSRKTNKERSLENAFETLERNFELFETFSCYVVQISLETVKIYDRSVFITDSKLWFEKTIWRN